MNPRAVRWWQWAVSGVLCVLIAIYARAIPWYDVGHSVREASPGWLAVAGAAFLAGVAVRGVLWWLFLREVGAPSVALAVRGMVLVTALHSVVVANAGEAGRVLLVTRRSRAAGRDVVATIAVERLLVTAVHLLMSAGVGVIAPLPDSLARWRTWIVGGFALMGVVLALLARPPRRAGAPAGVVRRTVREFAQTMGRLASVQRIAAAFALAAVWWMLNLATYHCVAIAMGLPISLSASAIAFLLVSAGSAAHATPGNLGVVQVVYASTAHVLGLPLDQAIGVALVVQALQTIPIVLISLPVVAEMFAAWRACAKLPE